MSQASDTTHELAAFLRARRERLTLAEVALPQRGRQRRTPGLRREEVAELAGVSTDYVVRLEQGRGLRPSPEVLGALAEALRLDRDERAYLFDLVGHRAAEPAGTKPAAAPELEDLVAELSPLPAMLVDHRFAILTWNPEMASLMTDFALLPDEQRNTMWLCLLHPDFRGYYLDREVIIRQGIADLRTAWAARPDDAELTTLIETLTSRSEEFVRLWAQRDVRVNGRGIKRLCHRTLGLLAVHYEVLIPAQNPEHRLVIYRPADSATQNAFKTL